MKMKTGKSKRLYLSLRRCSAVGLVLGLTLLLGACGGGGEDNQAATTEADGAPETSTVTLATPPLADESDGVAEQEVAGAEDPDNKDVAETSPIVSSEPVEQPGASTEGPSAEALVPPALADDVVLGPELTRDKLVAVVTSTLGPSDDLMAVVSKGGVPFPIDLPTMAGTEILSIKHGQTSELDLGFETYTTTIGFIAPAERQDVVLAYSTVLEGQGWDPDTGDLLLGGVAISDVAAEGTERPRPNLSPPDVRVTVKDRLEGGSIVEVQFSQVGLTTESMGLLDGWYGESPLPPEGEPNNSSIFVRPSPANNHEYVVSFNSSAKYPATSPEAFADQVQATLPASDWKFQSFDPERSWFNLDYLAEQSYLGFDEIGQDPFILASLSHDLTVAAAGAIPAASEVRNDDTVAPGDGASDGLELAEANGAVVAQTMGAEDIEAFLVDLIGPTDDLAGTLARLGPFPAAVPTLTDTELVEVALSNTAVDWLADGERTPENTRLIQSTSVTSTSPQDAVLAVQTSLTALGWEMVQANVDVRDDVTIHFSRLELGDVKTSVSVSAFTVESGQTLLGVDFSATTADLALRDLTEGWYGDEPAFGPGGTFNANRIALDSLDSDRVMVTFNSERLFPDTTEAEARSAAEAAAAASADWAVSDKTDSESLWLDFKDLSTDVVFLADIGDDGDTQLRLQHNRAVMRD